MGDKPRQGQFRQEHDPYNAMESAVTRPDFSSVAALSDAENNATTPKQSTSSKHSSHHRRDIQQDNKTIHSATDSLRRNETSPFINSVKGKPKLNKAKTAAKGGFLRRYGPIGAIAGLIFSGGLFFSLSQSILGPHIQSLVTKNTDYQYTSYALRNTRLFKYVMDGDGQVKINTFNKRYKTFSPFLKERLRKKGIEVGRLDGDGNFVADKLVSTNPRVLKFKDEIIDANSFTKKMASDVDFREAYYKAKRNRIANFFDPAAINHYRFYGETRDALHDFKSTGDQDLDDKNFKNNVTDNVSKSNFSANTAHMEENDKGEEVKTESGEDATNKNAVGDTPNAKAKSFINSLSSKVSTVGTPICGALRVVNIAAVTVSAYQILQGASYFMNMTEPISKAMAGNGSTSGINEMLNFFTTPETSTINYVDDNGQPQTKTTTGSPLESSGAKLILGETSPSQAESDAVAVDNITRAAMRIALSQGVTATTCNGVMASSAIMSLSLAGLPGGSLASIAVSAFMETVGGIVMTVAVTAIISAIMPQIIHIFTDNIFDNYVGTQAGDLYFMGASAANGRLAQDASGLMPASEERLKEQNRKAVIALADEAALDRKNRSPFDVTNENTFLGSILGKISPLSSSRNSTHISSNLATIVGDSIQHLTPGASAADQVNIYSSNYQECTNLPGAMCDFYGLPIPTADLSAIDVSPDDPIYQNIISQNLDEKGKIKNNSELAKFINFCSNRQSPWGVQDANILNALQSDAGIVVNNLPVVGDIIDVVNAVEDQANVDWATGANCVNSASNPRWDNEFKYYQLYIQDMRILDTMQGQEQKSSSRLLSHSAPEASTNPVIAYEQQYRESHPLDNSLEGTLARISGRTKDDIIFLREVAKYSQELANYHPEERFAFNNEIQKPTDIISALIQTNNQSQQISDINITSTAYRHLGYSQIFIDKRNYLL